VSTIFKPEKEKSIVLEKLKNLFKSQSAKVAELELALAQAQQQVELEQAVHELMQQTVNGLNASIALVEKRNDDNFRESMVTIGCLVSAAGGSVKLSKDLIEAMSSSSIRIGYNPVEDGVEVSLVLGEDEAEATDSCGCGE
jgi:DNA-binding transcriptional regulator YbjK